MNEHDAVSHALASGNALAERDADDALVARLRAAGVRARQERAPASLQARLERAYAERSSPAFRWHPSRLLPLSALAVLLVAAGVWTLSGPTGAGAGRDGRGASTDTLAPPAVARAPGTRTAGAVARVSTARPDGVPALSGVDAAAAGARAIAEVRPTERPRAITHVQPLRPHRAPRVPAGRPSSPQAPIVAAYAPPTPAVAIESVPALSLDLSALRIATTAPTLPQRPLWAPGATAVPQVQPEAPGPDASDGGAQDDQAPPSSPPT